MSTAHQSILVIPTEHPAFEGHFPGRPLLPGALLLDEVARRLPRPADAAVEFSRVKFRAPVLPGACLTLQYTARADGAQGFTVMDSTGAVVTDGTIRECR